MNVLLDTHILLWALTESPKLPQQALDIIADDKNNIYYSLASVWEVEIKYSLGKMPISGEELSNYCRESGFRLLEIKESHIFSLKTLKREETPKHNDPFDRIMLAQAKVEGVNFLTHDHLISQYNEPCVVEVK
jgi:PIN domain nuclease of toxin-antitoxin system